MCVQRYCSSPRIFDNDRGEGKPLRWKLLTTSPWRNVDSLGIERLWLYVLQISFHGYVYNLPWYFEVPSVCTRRKAQLFLDSMLEDLHPSNKVRCRKRRYVYNGRGISFRSSIAW